MSKINKNPKYITTLATPYKSTWPEMPPEKTAGILRSLCSTLHDLKVGRLGKQITHKKLKTRTKEIKRIKKVWLKEGTSHRQNVVIGLNAVIRGLEKGQLCAALICAEIKPKHILDHLFTLCLTRQARVAVLPRLADRLCAELGLKSCGAFGLKNAATDSKNPFHNCYLKILENTKPLPASITGTEKVVQIQSEAILGDVAGPSSRSSGVISGTTKPHVEPEKDYSYLYVYRSHVKAVKKQVEPIKQALPSFISLSSTSDSEESENTYISPEVISVIPRKKGRYFK